MKFLVDAQLPRKLTSLLRQAGHNASHTLDLPLGNRTPDSVLCDLSLADQSVLITKDADFVQSFLIHRRPWKLLLISTGNIANRDLEVLFLANLDVIVTGLDEGEFIEMNRTSVIHHF